MTCRRQKIGLPKLHIVPTMPAMKSQLSLCLCSLVLVSCTTSELATVATRVQEARQMNAQKAESARVRIWRDISTYSKRGWQLHSEQASRLNMPQPEFEKARDILITSGYTTWQDNVDMPLPPKKPLPDHIVELEWLNQQGAVSGGISVTKICRESELGTKTNIVFPFVLPDEAYDEFMAIPTIRKSLEQLKE